MHSTESGSLFLSKEGGNRVEKRFDSGRRVKCPHRLCGGKRWYRLRQLVGGGKVGWGCCRGTGETDPEACSVCHGLGIRDLGGGLVKHWIDCSACKGDWKEGMIRIMPDTLRLKIRTGRGDDPLPVFICTRFFLI